MTGFQAPNYTQVPNDFFEMAAKMGEAELKVVLCLIRETFGYHRETCELSIRALARQAGLTPRNAFTGAELAIARGLIEKTVSSTNTTKWRAVVTGDTAVLSQRIRTVSPRASKPPVKEIKETVKQNEDDDALRKISRAYQAEIGVLTIMIADELREASTAYPVQWTLDAIHEAAVQNKRGWKYVLAILTRWKAQGNQEAMKPVRQTASSGQSKQEQNLANIQSWLTKKEAQQNGNIT